MNTLLQLAAKELRGHLTDRHINNAFQRLPAHSAKPFNTQNPGAVCALQVKAKVYPSLDAMVRDIDRYMRAAVRRGAGLVCFPELFGLFTAFASPLVRGAFRALTALPSPSSDSDGDNALNVAELYEPFAFLPERYIAIMARFARRYNVWVSCGSVFAHENGRVYNRHFLLDDSGNIAGTQDKLHLVPEEAALGLSRGQTLTVVDTPFGRIALTVCMDATYFETFKIAKGLGADFALVPIANVEAYNYFLALRGAAMRSTETNLAAVKSALVSGKGFPVEITGRAGVYYPLGFGAKSRETPQHSSPAMVVETLDVKALRKYKPQAFCLPNRAFNKNAMRTYQEYFETAKK